MLLEYGSFQIPGEEVEGAATHIAPPTVSLHFKIHILYIFTHLFIWDYAV